MNKFFQRFVLVASAAIFATVVLGFFAGQFGWLGVRAMDGQDGAYKQITVYDDVLEHIQSDYVTEPNMNKVTTGALHGLLESLDADSSYLSPSEYKIYKDNEANAGNGVGLVVAKRYGYAVIVTILPGSPASKEHLSDGDIIESIDNQSTRDLSIAMIHTLLRGKPGTTVTISVVRQMKPEGDKITLTRGPVAAPALEEKQMGEANALYLKPGELTDATIDVLAAKIKAEGKGKNLILDLRDTATGDESAGIRLANLFISQGTLATLGGQKFPTQTFTADATKTITDAPLIVLVNRGTFGAAELVADAIIDAKRGDVLGEHTFGEGSVQKTFELPDGAALFLTVAKYASPAGHKIEDEGVTPTMLVGINEEDELTAANPNKTDEILAKAIELLKARAGAPAAAAAPVKN